MVMVGVIVTVFVEALDIIGDGDWEMAEHTVLAPPPHHPPNSV